MNSDTKLYGLLGRKLGHSYSAVIHRALGNPAYRLYEKEPDELEAFLRSDAIGGFNVTIPYKKTVLPFCDVLSDTVREIGAANTLVRKDGRLYAYNTDKTGFQYLVHSAGISVSGAKVLVLGSGGASLAVKAALRSLGAADLITISRNGPDSYDNLQKHYDADIIVNTTPVGMFPDTLRAPLSLSGFSSLRGVLDVIYNPHRTGLLLDAEQRGIPHAGGLAMLVAQAVASHQLFFGLRTDETDCPDDPRISEITSDLVHQTENIVLIGMPGSGKTSVANALSRLCGKPVIDLDSEIEKTARKTIPELFAQDGEDRFRQLESESIAHWGAQSGNILSLGGGAVLFERNYLPLHQNGRIYLIRRNRENLAMDGRPLSTDAERLKSMEQERMPLYLRFRDAEADNNGTVEATAETIWNDFRNAVL